MRSIVISLFFLILATPALATDGALEINQTCAVQTGCFTDDTAGFPVTIGSPGSYRLTSDLDVLGASAILVNSDDVSLDLNGFNIDGGGGSLIDGISLASHKNIEIRNGTIQGFSRDGIFSNVLTQYVRLIGLRLIGNTLYGADLQGPGNTVDGCTALNNGSVGIRVFDGSLVINTVARGNNAFGLVLSGPSGYRSSVLTGNNGGDANPQATGGLQLGSNVCGSDLVCP